MCASSVVVAVLFVCLFNRRVVVVVVVVAGGGWSVGRLVVSQAFCASVEWLIGQKQLLFPNASHLRQRI